MIVVRGREKEEGRDLRGPYLALGWGELPVTPDLPFLSLSSVHKPSLGMGKEVALTDPGTTNYKFGYRKLFLYCIKV